MHDHQKKWEMNVFHVQGVLNENKKELVVPGSLDKQHGTNESDK